MRLGNKMYIQMLTRIILPVASNDDAGAVLKLFDCLQFFASYVGVHVYLLLPHKLFVIFLPFLTYPSGRHIQLAVSASLIVTLSGLSLLRSPSRLKRESKLGTSHMTSKSNLNKLSVLQGM